MITAAVFSSQIFEREFLIKASSGQAIEWQFLQQRLTNETASLVDEAHVACALAIDEVDGKCLHALAACGVKMVAMRATGFNNVDVAAARELKLRVTRVPVYSPQAIAEHAVALLLTLNR